MNKFLTFLKSNKLLLLVIVVGVLLRFVNLSTIPISLNHDETAIGYNAYSLLTTGTDEYGKILPLSLKSFGDWKLPLYEVLDILPIILFGLNAFAVRFPSAISGVIAIPLIYILSNQIFRNKNISLLAALFLTLSPWGIFFSRISYEANVATTLFLASLILFTKYYFDKGNGKLLVLSSILLGLTIFTYHAFVIFAPLYFICIILMLLIKKEKLKNKWTILGISTFCIFVIISIFASISSGSINKLSTTSLFDDKHMIEERVNKLRGDNSGEDGLPKVMLHNKYTAVVYQIGQNYIATFSPSFLFDKGGEKFLHNIGNYGNFHLIDALFLIIGFIAIFYYREKRILPLIFWFLVGPIPSAITTDAPSSTRLFLLLPAFILVASYGAYTIYDYLKKFGKIIRISAILLLSLVYLVNFAYFFDAYFVHMNYHRAQFFHYGYKEAVELSNKYPDYKVVMFDPTNFPYISFLFYNKYDPVKFRKEVNYYPENFGPFYYVKSFGRYEFTDTIDYENLQEKTLYIDYRGIRNEDYKILDPSGKPVFKYFFKE